MTRPIEAVVAEAEQRLERTGRLDIAAFASAYPEHETELRELLPVMLNLHQEKRWRKAATESQAFAVALFPQLVEQPATGTVASLFERERTEAGAGRHAGLRPGGQCGNQTAGHPGSSPVCATCQRGAPPALAGVALRHERRRRLYP
jgi:hypothetical protein